jgi:DNA-binding transcriptional MerR regulator
MRTQLPEKLYYSIGEVSEAFDVNPSLIRFWEKEFEHLTPKKNARGTRKFTARDIDKIELIHYLVKERGFTLEGAKKEIISQSGGGQHQIVRRLKSIREELLRIRENL